MGHAAIDDSSQLLGVGISGLGRSSSRFFTGRGRAIGFAATLGCFCLSSLLFSSMFSSFLFTVLLLTGSVESLVFHLGLTSLLSELVIDLVSSLSEILTSFSLSFASLLPHSLSSFACFLPLFTASSTLLSSALGVLAAFSHVEVSGKVSEVPFQVLSTSGTFFILSALGIILSILLVLCFLAGSSTSLAMACHFGFMAFSDGCQSLMVLSDFGLSGGCHSLVDLADVRESLASFGLSFLSGGSTLFFNGISYLPQSLVKPTVVGFLHFFVGLVLRGFIHALN